MLGIEKDTEYDLDRMVQLVGEAVLDACPGNYRSDLADSLPAHPHQLRLRVRADDSWQGQLAGGVALRH